MNIIGYALPTVPIPPGHRVEYLADGLCADAMCACGRGTERRHRGGETTVVCLATGEIVDRWSPADTHTEDDYE